MKAVVVNSLAKDKSTGKISYGLYSFLKNKGHEAFMAYGQGPVYKEDGLMFIGSRIGSKLHNLLSKITGFPGCFSLFSTKKFLKKLDQIGPDVVYLFNIHGYYLNEYMLLNYLKKKHIRTIYTMLDEYPFMGRCGFSMGCDHYISGCHNCPHLKNYPGSWLFDTSHILAKKKKIIYDGFTEITFVAIQYTLNLASKSYLLSGKDLFMADEAIDVKKYYPRETKHLKERLCIPKENKVIVCIAVYPDDRKGAQFFLDAARSMKDEKNISFVHVGFGGNVEECPSNYIPIAYVANQEELCEYYSLGDLLCFPSLSETIPSTCLEALSCGTPLLVFNISGMPYIADDTCSYIVEPKDVSAMVNVIKNIPYKSQSTIDACRGYAVKRYDNQLYYSKLLSLAQ